MAWNGRAADVHRTRREPAPDAPRQRQLLPLHGLLAPDTIPGFSRARLPPSYEAAQKALAQCCRVDECKSWEDKAAALASYARQARDESLRAMAARIHARAIRRCGDLLKQIPSGQGSKNQRGKVRDGTVTRREMAAEAGLSERQTVTALRVASVPAAKFAALVDGESPPTVTKLAALGTLPSERGRKRRRTTSSARPIQVEGYVEFEPTAEAPSQRQRNGSGHPDPVRAAQARKVFWSMREFCQANAPADLAGAFAAADSELLRELATDLREWLDRFVANLP